MTNVLLVPPIKCQGIKTKLVPEIKALAVSEEYARWVEPFCGSCVVALNVQPKKALLSDTNTHIIRFYRDVQTKVISAGTIKEFLAEEGERLRNQGEAYYYQVRDRFNHSPNSYDFLFLNRSCFNGVMRFNRKGHFNVPFCHKTDRFSKAYVTKIVNQVRSVATVIHSNDWQFAVSDFRAVMTQVKPTDLVYADPPYTGRHADYFNTWSDADEDALIRSLQNLSAKFILSTWHSNEFRINPVLSRDWSYQEYHLLTKPHYYHVGSYEDLRHAMLEALITNIVLQVTQAHAKGHEQLRLLEVPFVEYTVNGDQGE
ncbi:MAG: Dam family site-specific DNA-(adenine-N6)-methyltransferase [Anaerolineae bacterium]